jgi:hypothetical protein
MVRENGDVLKQRRISNYCFRIKKNYLWVEKVVESNSP